MDGTVIEPHQRITNKRACADHRCYWCQGLPLQYQWQSKLPSMWCGSIQIALPWKCHIEWDINFIRFLPLIRNTFHILGWWLHMERPLWLDQCVAERKTSTEKRMRRIGRNLSNLFANHGRWIVCHISSVFLGHWLVRRTNERLGRRGKITRIDLMLIPDRIFALNVFNFVEFIESRDVIPHMAMYVSNVFWKLVKRHWCLLFDSKISLNAWMILKLSGGGTIETIPCSRVGHIFRDFHPYQWVQHLLAILCTTQSVVISIRVYLMIYGCFFRFPDNKDTHGINTVRLAQVWMDEYIDLFYMNRPDLKVSRFVSKNEAKALLSEWITAIVDAILESSGYWRCDTSACIARQIKVQVVWLVFEKCLSK